MKTKTKMKKYNFKLSIYGNWNAVRLESNFPEIANHIENKRTIEVNIDVNTEQFFYLSELFDLESKSDGFKIEAHLDIPNNRFLYALSNVLKAKSINNYSLYEYYKQHQNQDLIEALTVYQRCMEGHGELYLLCLKSNSSKHKNVISLTYTEHNELMIIKRNREFNYQFCNTYNYQTTNRKVRVIEFKANESELEKFANIFELHYDDFYTLFINDKFRADFVVYFKKNIDDLLYSYLPTTFELEYNKPSNGVIARCIRVNKFDKKAVQLNVIYNVEMGEKISICDSDSNYIFSQKKGMKFLPLKNIILSIKIDCNVN